MEKIIVKDTYHVMLQDVMRIGTMGKQMAMHIFKEGADGKTYKAKIEWEETNQFVSTETIEPALLENYHYSGKSNILQSMLDTLHMNDLMPKRGESEQLLTGKIEATEKHLEDMRRLVFEDNSELKVINVKEQL